MFEKWKGWPAIDECSGRQGRGEGHAFAGPALHALETRGIWSLVRLWTACLQERLLQTQLKLAAQIQLLQQQQQSNEDAASTDNDDVILRVQHPHRRELLSLQLEAHLTVPRLLQATSTDEIQAILMELVESERVRKPFPLVVPRSQQGGQS